ncbi:hypothetical protein DL766_009677 [Monosporascus sp. MC13-8B]|uniref:Alcohol dehydrogenase N-terminal domain-containing protein n=1 Tax=Monosporascus cannonballus TaxID=155416 RepID=A0ABY0GVS1_9PEZI|nr:hypothetical protein DL762_010140 [Monosporascus cannonballus]RYO89933.1 hypothetical protein DL763_005489 [Monosporascus cannonballus]RYP14452.1 hypothetical protein DL766_009677 [Monosporascus sp. MC13-8B]
MPVQAKMKAIEMVDEGSAEIREVHVPLLRDEHPRARCGCDYVGVVKEVGSKITELFRKGDRFAGFVHGAQGRCADQGPDNLSNEEAATLAISNTTVLPVPTGPAAEPYPVLIHGGATVTGLLRVQFAKISGLRVVTAWLAVQSPIICGRSVPISRAFSDDPRREPRQGAIVPVDEEALYREIPNVRGRPLVTLGYEIFSQRCAFSWGQVPAEARRVRVHEGNLGDEPRACSAHSCRVTIPRKGFLSRRPY